MKTKAKKVHMAGKTRGDGAVSALCAKVPRAINLKQATWTLRPEAVTCQACLLLLRVEKDTAQ